MPLNMLSKWQIVTGNLYSQRSLYNKIYKNDLKSDNIKYTLSVSILSGVYCI